VEGMAEACRHFDTPVTGGNVSLYNESPLGAIDPTPTVGMVGLIEDPSHITTQNFKGEGDVILLLGDLGDEWGGSHYLLICHGKKDGFPPRLDMAKEKNLHDTLRALIRQGLVRSAHDCAEGGLAVALAESCISGEARLGAKVDFGTTGLRADRLLFNESQSRVLISVPAELADKALAFAASQGVPASVIGTVGGDKLSVATDGGTWEWSVTDLHDRWYYSIARCMEDGQSQP
jgi:phosphoribosylformylglycinamidine (FGAM) synthase-like enzyme